MQGKGLGCGVRGGEKGCRERVCGVRCRVKRCRVRGDGAG